MVLKLWRVDDNRKVLIFIFSIDNELRLCNSLLSVQLYRRARGNLSFEFMNNMNTMHNDSYLKLVLLNRTKYLYFSFVSY